MEEAEPPESATAGGGGGGAGAAAGDAAAGHQWQWKWADAGTAATRALARANPLRWSKAMPGPSVVADLRGRTTDKDTSRPVELQLVGESNIQEFASPRAAASWLEQQRDSDARRLRRMSYQYQGYGAPAQPTGQAIAVRQLSARRVCAPLSLSFHLSCAQDPWAHALLIDCSHRCVGAHPGWGVQYTGLHPGAAGGDRRYVLRAAMAGVEAGGGHLQCALPSRQLGLFSAALAPPRSRNPL
jgi:hypothetical protein